MRKAILLSALLHTLPAMADVTIIENYEHLVTIGVYQGYYEFTIEYLKDYTNDLSGNYPNLDFPKIQVDVNANGKKDSDKDLYYSFQNGSSTLVCAGYTYNGTSTRPCGSSNSQSKAFSYFEKTVNNPVPHIWFKFLIPKAEITTSPQQQFLYLNIQLYSANKGYTNYPTTGLENFDSMIAVKLPTTQP